MHIKYSDNDYSHFKFTDLHRKIERIVSVAEEIQDFAFKLYGKQLNKVSNEYIRIFNLKEDEKRFLQNLYIWWYIFTEPMTTRGRTVFQLFCKNYLSRSNNIQLTEKHLLSWKKCCFWFYIVKDIRQENLLIVEDIINPVKKFAAVDEGIFPSPIVSDVITGLFVPIGKDCIVPISGYNCLQTSKFLQWELKNLLQQSEIEVHRNYQEHFPACLKIVIDHLLKKSRLGAKSGATIE